MVTKRETPDQTSGAGTGGAAPGGRGRLLLLDGHSMAFRAFFALPVENFGTSTGQATNAVYGFTSMLVKLLREEEPTHVAVAWDLSGPTFRHEAYADYKDGRSETPPELPSQVSLSQDLMRLLGVANLSVQGFEADDVIATLAHQGGAEGMEVLIASGDRDAFQLITDDCTVLYPGQSLSDMRRMTPEAIQDKYGVSPERYRDLTALVGEKADNLPGVPGVGPKTAAKWIAKYGSLDELVAHAEEIPGKAGQSLRDNLDDVLRNQRLNLLATDVALDVAPDRLVRGEIDRAGVDALFDNLEFASSLRDRLYAVVGSGDAAVNGSDDAGGDTAAVVELTVAGTGELADWIDRYAPAGAEAATAEAPLGLAVDGTWGQGTGRVDALAVSVPDGAAVYVDAAALDPSDTRALEALLADPGRPKAVHEYKGVLMALGAHGWDLGGVVSDTALAAYLVQPGQRRFDLADLSRRYLGRELEDDGDGAQLSLDIGGEAGASRQHRLAVRAAAIRDLAGDLAAELDQRGGTHLLGEVELPLVDVLARMERAGIAADQEYLEGLQSEFAAAAGRAVEKAHEIVGREFNLGSPKQLQQVLFEELQLPRTKKIKTGYTTDASALEWLAAQTDHELPGVLLHHRDQTKLRTTVEGLTKTIADDGRIHTTFNQTVAATGRLSSADPNLQNIPVRTDVGRRIRRAFVVGQGFDELLTADYSQIELRIMAHLSQEQALIEAFASGYDFHAQMAARVFGIGLDQVDGEARSRIKAMSYGLAYGLSAYGLSQQLDIQPDEAKKLMEDYFAEFGGVRDYLNAVVEHARRVGYTETILGRRRYLPDLTSDNRQRRDMAERMALNAPIQGSAADIIKVAMLRVDTALTEGGYTSRVLLQVHDELVVEIAPGEREEIENLVTREMGSAYDLRVPLAVSVGSGQSWHDAAH